MWRWERDDAFVYGTQPEPASCEAERAAQLARARICNICKRGVFWLALGGVLSLVCLVLVLTSPSSTDVSDPAAQIVQNMTEPESDAGETDPNEVPSCLVRTWPPECIGYIAVAALVGFVAFFLFVPCLLSLLGFRRIGVREGSGAAHFQSTFGTPSAFSGLQSEAMRGVTCGCRSISGLAGLIVGGCAGAYWLPMCFTDEGSPVYGLNNYTSAALEQYHHVVHLIIGTSDNSTSNPL